ncbi:peptide deformylase [Brenneria sp. 4F2]|nr:peptide deformylase [Brenneria bubanii]
MTATDVLWIDDRRMQQVSQPVDTIDDNVKALVERMFTVIDEMKDSGLAAIQLGIPQRVVVIDMFDERGKRQRLALINPQITEYSREKTSHLELCSSIPEHPMPAERSKRVTVTFRDLDDNTRQIDAGGEFAVCLQHEIDHLDGLSLLDSLSALKRSRLKAQLAKLRRKAVPDQ